MSGNGTRAISTWLRLDGFRVSLTRERNSTEIQVYRTVCAVCIERQWTVEPLRLSQPGCDVENHPIVHPALLLPSLSHDRLPDGQTTVKRNTVYGGRRDSRQEFIFFFFIRLQNRKSHGNACWITNVREARFVSYGRKRAFPFFWIPNQNISRRLFTRTRCARTGFPTFSDDKRRKNVVFSDVSK